VGVIECFVLNEVSQSEVAVSANAAKELVRQFYAELFRDLAIAEECVGPDYLDHNNEQAGLGPEVLRAHVAALLTTFPDFSMKIEDIIAEEDRVVTRVTGKGTHTGTWMQIAPTGSVVQVRGINIDRVAEGRIVEHWGEADTIGMLMQMGVDPFVGRING
jgi:predicted ester cyclase